MKLSRANLRVNPARIRTAMMRVNVMLLLISSRNPNPSLMNKDTATASKTQQRMPSQKLNAIKKMKKPKKFCNGTPGAVNQNSKLGKS